MSLDFNQGSLDWASLEKNLDKDAVNNKKNYKDERFWSLSRDENGNGGAIIRLLPDPEGKPFIMMYNHAFQSFDNVNKKKRWYIANSPSTIGLPCPASDLWAAIYNEGSEEGKVEAKNFSRKMTHYVNIKVIKDPANPQNEGKIFLWKFGTKLKDKFMAALNPSETDRAMGEEPKQLFNPLLGNNIKLKIANVAGFPNYDGTTIEAASSIYNSGEEAKQDIINNAYVLSEFKKPESFETYEELKGKMKYVLECYTPKNLTPERFKEVIAPVVADVVKPVTETVQQEQVQQTAAPQETAQPVQTQQTTQPVEQTAPAQEVPVQTQQTTQTTQTTQSSVSDDDDLGFLDEL